MPDALRIARDADLDLVEVAPMANPPVCRIMDHGKHLYEEAQKLKESRRRSVQTSIKEMKYRPKIGKGDFDTKTKHVLEFLEEGHKVKVTIMFRGREMHHPEIGMDILKQVEVTLGENAKVEAAPKIDGRNMIMVLSPNKKPVKPAPKSGEAHAPKTKSAVSAGEPAPVTDSAPEAVEVTEVPVVASVSAPQVVPNPQESSGE